VAEAAEAWPDKRPPPLPTTAAKAADQPLKTVDKDGYLETSIGAAAYDDRCSGYLDAVEPAPPGGHPPQTAVGLISEQVVKNVCEKPHRMDGASPKCPFTWGMRAFT